MPSSEPRVPQASGPDALGNRILILAPTTNDARLTEGFLARAGIEAVIARDLPDLCGRVEEGCGGLLLAEEVLGQKEVQQLVEVLARQPTWSDIPIAVITSGGEASQARLRRLAVFGPGGNVTLLERPFRPDTLISTVEVALRSRRRQYEVAGLLKKLQTGEDRLRHILDSIKDAFVSLDKEWRFTYVNQEYLNLVSPTYSSTSDLIGHNIWDCFPDIKDSDIARFYQRAMSEQSPGTYEYYYDRRKLWLEIRAYPSPETLSLYIRDITQRKKNETAVVELTKKVQDQALLFDKALSNIADLAYTFDLEGRFLYANKSLLEILGRPAEDVIGKNCFDLEYPPELANKLHAELLQVGRTGVPIHGEVVMTSAAGVPDYHEYIYSPAFDSEGKVVAVTGTTRITTKKKEIEKALRESEEKLSQIVALMPAAVYACDGEGKITFYNRRAAELWGREPDPQSEGCRFGAFTRLYLRNGELLGPEATPMALAVRDGKSFRDVEAIAERPDGTSFTISMSIDAIRDESGNSIGAINVLQDITERRQVETAIRQLASIVESSDDAIISKDLEGVIVSWNHGAERLFGYKPEEVIGKPITILIPPQRNDEEPGILERIRRGEPMRHYETIRQRKDGTLIDVSLSVSPIKDRVGRVIGVSKIARDITEQKKNAAALKEAKEAAEAANRSKDHFLAVLSHELRTPLTPVLMSVAARERDPNLPPHLKAEMTMIRRNVELETKLIDDLLDLSRVTSGKLKLRLDEVDFNAAVQQVCEICRSQILEKNIQLRTYWDKTVGHVRADSPRLQQVLWNVVKNAAKFTPENGKIQISTRAVGNHVQVTVEDSGVGIPEDTLPRIFDAFEQGHEKITRQFGGLGLGLAISKAIIELHGGTISAQSAGAGQGSTFIIELPVVAGPVRPHLSGKKVPHTPGGTLRLLVVEDHFDTAIMLSRLLQSSGYFVKTAGDVATALQIAASEPFDLLISDVGLPDATGYTLMQKIRETYSMKGIAMSGYGMDEDIRKSLEAGFNEHLVKPVNIQALEQAIQRII